MTLLIYYGYTIQIPSPLPSILFAVAGRKVPTRHSPANRICLLEDRGQRPRDLFKYYRATTTTATLAPVTGKSSAEWSIKPKQKFISSQSPPSPTWPMHYAKGESSHCWQVDGRP